MEHFNIPVKIIEDGIHSGMHLWLQQRRIIEPHPNIIGRLRNIYSAQSSQLWRIREPQKIKNGIAAKGLGCGVNAEQK